MKIATSQTELPELSRREFLGAAVGTASALAAGLALPVRAFADSSAVGASSDAARALAAASTSPLIYVSPLKKDGRESRCHAEVWFVAEGEDLLVVTNPERWRAACIAAGLDRARIWVGDFGPWKKSDGAFRKAPSYVASARLDRDPARQKRALETFGTKYADEWDKWGPRFRDGLASGERVMIRYTPAA